MKLELKTSLEDWSVGNINNNQTLSKSQQYAQDLHWFDVPIWQPTDSYNQSIPSWMSSCGIINNYNLMK